MLVDAVGNWEPVAAGESGCAGDAPKFWGGGVPLERDRAADMADTPGPCRVDIAGTPARGSTSALFPFVPLYTIPLVLGVGVGRRSGVLLYCEGTGDSANLAVEAALDGLCP